MVNERWYVRLPKKVIKRLRYCTYLVQSGTGGRYGKYTQDERKSPHPNMSRDLREMAGLETVYDQTENHLIVRSKTTTFHLSSSNFLATLKEVYVHSLYRFHCKRDCVVLDIGANEGASVLYFAEMDQVKKIIGYEPFKPTYGKLLENIAINPNLASKITVINEGVAKADGSVVVDFCPTMNSVSSVTGPLIDLENRPLVKETIILKAAVDVVQRILQENKSLELVVKIDCEGSEYEIIESLDEAKLLPNISTILMEWHTHGPQSLVDTLERNGYVCLVPGYQGEISGMMYAVNPSLQRT